MHTLPYITYLMPHPTCCMVCVFVISRPWYYRVRSGYGRDRRKDACCIWTAITIALVFLVGAIVTAVTLGSIPITTDQLTRNLLTGY